MSLLPTLIALVVIAVIFAAWLLWRSSQRSAGTSRPAAPNTAVVIDARPEFPPAGLLVPEEVLRSAGSTSAAIWMRSKSQPRQSQSSTTR